jgi:hypothetical protein
MKKIIIFTLGFILLFSGIAQALELVRQKNVATYIVVPLIDADGDIVTGAAGLDSERNYWADGSAPQTTFADCTNEATEIGTTGIYYLSLTAAELNYQYVAIQIKTSTTGAKTQHILIRTTIGAPANFATTDDGGTINVTGGAVDTVTTTTTATTATNLTNAPTNGDLTATMKTSVTTAATSSTPALSAAGIDAIWDEAASGHTTTGTFGKYLDKQLTTFNDITAASVWSVATRLLTAGTNIALAKGTGVTGFNDITAANVWDTNISAYSGAGYAGTYLKGIYDKLPAGTIGTSTYAGGAVASVSGSVGSISGITFPTNFGVLSISATTGLVDITQTAADKVWATSARALTDKSGFSLSQTFPANFSALSISSGGLVDILQTAADKAWSTTARTLTAGTNIALAKGTGVTGFNDIAATDVWAAATRTLTSGGYSGLTATDIDNVWDELITGHITGSSFAKLFTDNLNATISSRSSHSAADVATLILATPAYKLVTDSSGRVTVGSNADKTGYSISGTKTTLDTLNDITAAAVWTVVSRSLTDKVDFGLSSVAITAIWDKNISGYTTDGLAGYYLKNAGGGSSPAEIADAVWDELLAGHITSGSTGKKLNDSPTLYDVGP